MTWLKNVNSLLTKQQKNGWVTCKCQQILWNIALNIKPSLRVENRTQCTNHQMNNAVTNHVYPKNHNLSGLIVWYDERNF